MLEYKSVIIEEDYIHLNTEIDRVLNKNADLGYRFHSSSISIVMKDEHTPHKTVLLVFEKYI